MAQELAVGYMSGKLLLKLDAITYILQHHASENFAFLDDPANSRNRSTFYYILARLLFMEDTPSKFKTFVAPLQQVLPDSAAGAAALVGGSRSGRRLAELLGRLRVFEFAVTCCAAGSLAC